MAIIPAFNSHSLRLRLGNCGVSLVEVSCVWKVRHTLVLVCVPQVYVPLLFFYSMFMYCCALSSGSAHPSGCVVNGPSAMAAS